MPYWVPPTVFALLFLAVWFAFAWRNTSRQVTPTLSRRSNPTRPEFLELMGGDASPEVSEFLWANALTPIQPRLTPHPDDDLVQDLPIDDEEWSMDWPKAFADLHGFKQSAYPDWPKEMPPTLRNLGKWLDAGRAGAQR